MPRNRPSRSWTRGFSRGVGAPSPRTYVSRRRVSPGLRAPHRARANADRAWRVPRRAPRPLGQEGQRALLDDARLEQRVEVDHRLLQVRRPPGQVGGRPGRAGHRDPADVDDLVRPELLPHVPKARGRPAVQRVRHAHDHGRRPEPTVQPVEPRRPEQVRGRPAAERAAGRQVGCRLDEPLGGRRRHPGRHVPPGRGPAVPGTVEEVLAQPLLPQACARCAGVRRRAGRWWPRRGLWCCDARSCRSCTASGAADGTSCGHLERSRPQPSGTCSRSDGPSDREHVPLEGRRYRSGRARVEGSGGGATRSVKEPRPSRERQSSNELAEDLLEHGDVVGAAGEELAALGGGEPGPAVGAAELERAGERPARAAPDLGRGVRAGGRAEPDDPAQGLRAQPRPDEAAGVVGRDGADQALLDPEEPGHGVEGLARAR